jgi:hypothetical protein
MLIRNNKPLFGSPASPMALLEENMDQTRPRLHFFGTAAILTYLPAGRILSSAELSSP